MTNTGDEAEESGGRGSDGDHLSVSAAHAENCGVDAAPSGVTLWADELAALVRGLAHALSNRVGTIVAVGSMLTPGAEAPAALVGMLRDEGERLEALLGLLRLLGGESGEPGDPEPVHLPDVVGPIVALHAQHPALRDVPVAVSDADVAPVRARRDGLARALLVLLSAAKRGGEARVAWHADGRTVALRVDGAAGEPHAAAAAAAAAAALLGEPVRATETGYEVALPALGGLG